MRLIFIRHGEPNYELDCLTNAGSLEAELLAKRVRTWDVTRFYCSPLGRAQATAAPSLKLANRHAETLDWLREFYCGRYQMPDQPMQKNVPWDFMPAYWTAQPELGDRDRWTMHPIMQAMPDGIDQRFSEVKTGLDTLLAQHGYVRENGYYRTSDDTQRDATLVFFCHLGVTDVMCGHLLNIAPPLLWQSFFLPPSSVTVLNTEERQPGIAAFRCQVMGDTSHLKDTGAPVSAMGAFGTVFEG